MVRVLGVDFDIVVAIGGLAEVDIDPHGGAFGDEMAGEHREADTGALQGAFRDEFRGADGGVVRDRLIDLLRGMHRILFLRVNIQIMGAASVVESLLGTVIDGVLGSPSKVDAVCALATMGNMRLRW